MEIEEFGYKQELKRSLTLTDLVVYGMIFMIPIAPFGVYGYVNAEAPGMVPLAYIIGMVAMLFTALSYGSMAKAFPVAGSVYSYAQRGLNQHVGFIAGWLMLLDYLLIPPLLYLYSAMALNHLRDLVVEEADQHLRIFGGQPIREQFRHRREALPVHCARLHVLQAILVNPAALMHGAVVLSLNHHVAMAGLGRRHRGPGNVLDAAGVGRELLRDDMGVDVNGLCVAH